MNEDLVRARLQQRRPETRGTQATCALLSFVFAAGFNAGSEAAVEPAWPVVPAFERLRGEREPAQLGELLLGELGCVACHTASEPHETRIVHKVAPRLDDVGSRVRPEYLTAFLDDPQSVKPGTTMPRLARGLPAPEREKVIEGLVHFLMSRRSPGPRPRRATGRRERGRLLYHSVGCVACHEPDPGFRWPDAAPEEETIAPETPSAPLTGLRSKYGPGALVSFLLDPLASRPGGRMPRLGLTEEEAADIAAYLVGDDPVAAPKPDWEPDTTLAGEGTRSFRELGCARCHGEPGGAGRSPPRSTAPPLARVVQAPLDGCLAESPPPSTPDFSLDDRQRRALRAALVALPSSAPLSIAERIERTLGAFNCYACHERARLGGPTPARAMYFRSLELDMGDEGRFPPRLDAAGRKFKLEALRTILAGRGAIRRYMATRMPDFGAENLAGLPNLLRAADLGTERWPQEVIGRNRYGRELVGTTGMSCISCHDLAGHRSLGMRALDLALLPDRVRPAWFRDYMMEPSEFRPATRMPSFWPEGKSAAAKVLGGKPLEQMDAIWVYLREAAGTRLPVGLEKPDIFELAPGERPIVLRTFMKSAGTHAIAVGYPQGVHLAFDAEAARLALTWKGRFIDAESTWDDRFTPLIGPLGEDVLEWPNVSLLAVLSGVEDRWPEAVGSAAGYRFEGYRFDRARLPTFLYRWRSVHVQDRYAPLDGGGGFERTLAVSGAVEGLWLLAARGRTLRELPAGEFRVDERWSVTCGPGTASPRLHRGDETVELRVPIGWREGQARVILRLEW